MWCGIILLTLLAGAAHAQNVTDTSASTTPATSTTAPPTTSANNSPCIYSGTSPPPAGLCTGPLDRTSARRSSADTTNNGCSLSQRLYYPDGLESATPQCGECVPGSSGVDDPELACELNQYCDDTARCRNARHSPFYGLACPWEQGGPSAQGWCGPGLRCIQHVCRVCLEGVVDPTDGKVCVNGAWTYSRWQQMGREPVPVLLALVLAVLLAHSLVLLAAGTPLRFRLVRTCRGAMRELRQHLSQLPGLGWTAPVPYQPPQLAESEALATPRSRATDQHMQMAATPSATASTSAPDSPATDDAALLAAYTRRNGTRFGYGHY